MPVEILDEPATAFDRILSDFLDVEGNLVIDGREKTAEMAALDKYTATEKMLKKLDETVAQIDADTLALTGEAVADFRALKYLRKVFDCYRPALEIDTEQRKKKFEGELAGAVGRRIRQIRQRQGMTLEKFAGALNLSRIALNRYELGWRLPPVTALFQIAKVFGVSTDWLILGEGGGSVEKKLTS